MTQDVLDEVVAAARRSKRYRTIAPETLQRLGRRALSSADGNVADASKRLKRQLHQVFGAYIGAPPAYGRWLKQLQPLADQEDLEALHRGLLRCMSNHASTRERLPFLDRFYEEILAITGAPGSVLDVACGLNPLSIPWMNLPEGCRYSASDIDGQMIEFVHDSLALLGLNVTATVADALSMPAPEKPVDLLLLLKTVPCLEQQEPGSGLGLLDRLSANHVVVSFPTRSLGGRAKGVAVNYARQFEPAAAKKGWCWDRLEFPNELVYVLREVT